MFVRIRWFTAGVIATIGGLGYLVAQVKKARQKLTPASLVAAGKRQAATWLDNVADVVSPDETGRRGS